MEQLKRTPLYDKHVGLKAKIVPFAGWEMPVSYPSGIISEHNAVRERAGIFDIGHMGIIKIEGEGALALIQHVATNDASLLEINQCQYSVLCNEKGGTIDDILVYRLPMSYIIIANASNADKDLAWIKKHATAKANVGFYENYCMLSLQGKDALKVAAEVLNAPLSSLKHNRLFWWRDIIISRTGYTGDDGVEFIVSKKELAGIWDLFIKKGVAPIGLGARDTLRLEAGLPLYGHEYNEETSPLEAGYSWAVKFGKASFIGKEALLKQKEALPKHLVGISLEGRAIPRQGAQVYSGDGKNIIGIVTSGTYSPTFKRPIALAYLKTNASNVAVEIRGEKLPGAVVDKAFYKRVK
ncbi:MAG: glycine cleavage system aminomethyltransferase GcvT [Candidatus Margulisiibacteriota bacterium]